MDTEAAHSRKVAKAAKGLQTDLARVDRQINEIAVSGFKEIGELMDVQTGLVEGEYSAEIRSAFRGMTERQRSDTLMAALSDSNSEVIAAIGLSPAILSGVTKEHQDRYLDAIRQQKAPELIRESEDLSEALNTATAASRLAGMMFDENYKASEQAAIDRAESDTAEAEAALTASMDG